MAELRPALVEAALLKLLRDKLDAHTQVRGLSSKTDIDEQGNIVGSPPAVLALLDVGDDLGDDTTRTVYACAQKWLLICGAANLSSDDNERNDVLQLLGDVRNLVAGVKLLLDTGEIVPPIELNGFERFQFDKRGTWYAQRITIQQAVGFDVKT